MRRLAILMFGCVLELAGQANHGSLHLRVTDSAGRGIRAQVQIASDANQYHSVLDTDSQGLLDVRQLPYGTYTLEIQQEGFSPVSQSVAIRSSLPTSIHIPLSLATIHQTLTVTTAPTLIDPEQPGSVNEIGTERIAQRLGSIPGRSLQDLVNSQPGWLYEGNAVLHPRGSEYQTQFVVDGIPLTENLSPGFGPELEADDVQSVSVYTAGIPAEYGRKMGGIVEVNTVRDAQAGFHGDVVLSGGSFASAGAFAKAQYTQGKNTLGGSANGSRTDHYLNPVVPQNYSNTGTLGDFALFYQRDADSNNRLGLSVRHAQSQYDIPNEQVQQAAGQRQTAGNAETMGIAWYEHIYSSRTLGELRGMIRDNAGNFQSNPQSTPIEVFQHNGFRDGYFKAMLTADRGHSEWKVGVEADNVFLRENTSYVITDPAQFEPGTRTSFAFSGNRPDLEQAAFLQDLMHIGNWTVSAGLRWDHYQLLVNRHAVEPRFSVSHYLPSWALILHVSYDRVFQTPSSQNILLSSSAQVESLNPTLFLRLPVQPSQGDYYEAGWTKALLKKVRLDVNAFRRNVGNFADDDQIENTSISFPISFRRASIYGAEAKLDVPDWNGFSGFLSYSYQVGMAWNPVTGGLFLGANAAAAQMQLTGHFPITQDQRNTARGRMRYQARPWLWAAGGAQFDSGLPFQFDGNPATALAEYGPRVLSRVNFQRGRIRPSFLVNASAGTRLHKSDRMSVELQADGENLTNLLDVLDFNGLFSGNALGPSRSFMLRLTTSF
jgi:hypothetical protein